MMLSLAIQIATLSLLQFHINPHLHYLLTRNSSIERKRDRTSMAKTIPLSFPSVQTCSSHNRNTHTIISDLNGTLLRSPSSFPYFALAAFDIGGPLRLLFLLILSPLYTFLHHFVSESTGIQVLIFASLADAKLSTFESVVRVVLPKFYAEDLHPETWWVLLACGRRCVVTDNPTVMVEPFLKEYLGIDVVVGTKLGVLIDTWFNLSR